MPATAPPPTDERPPAAPRRRIGRYLALGVAVAMLGMWAYIFAYHLSGGWKQDTPGRLQDRGWGESAEPVCASTMAQLAALPAAPTAPDAAARADVIDRSDVLLGQMLGELAALPAPTGDGDATAVDEWLTDWSAYLQDRADYADRLRDDPDARFYVTQSERDERQITEAVDRFAAVNGMPSCQTPSDIA